MPSYLKISDLESLLFLKIFQNICRRGKLYCTSKSKEICLGYVLNNQITSLWCNLVQCFSMKTNFHVLKASWFWKTVVGAICSLKNDINYSVFFSFYALHVSEGVYYLLMTWERILLKQCFTLFLILVGWSC